VSASRWWRWRLELARLRVRADVLAYHVDLGEPLHVAAEIAAHAVTEHLLNEPRPRVTTSTDWRAYVSDER
jgi:hypothetical protein